MVERCPYHRGVRIDMFDTKIYITEQLLDLIFSYISGIIINALLSVTSASLK